MFLLIRIRIIPRKQKMKKNLDLYCFVLTMSIKIFFVGTSKVTDREQDPEPDLHPDPLVKSTDPWIRSPDPYPDPYQNVIRNTGSMYDRTVGHNMTCLCLGQVLSVTLVRYQDAASRRMVVDFIHVALAKSPEAVARTIHAGLLEVSPASANFFLKI
jgi:hypothetical protein